MYDSIFPDGKMTKGWYDLMFSPVPKSVSSFEKDGELFGLVCITDHGGAYIINSIAKDNQKYTFGMQRLILNFTRNNDRVIVMSTLKDSCIKKFTDKFVDNGEQSCFVKGL